MIAEQCSDLVRSGKVDVDLFRSKVDPHSSVRGAIVDTRDGPRAQDAFEEGSDMPSWLEHASWAHGLSSPWLGTSGRGHSGHCPDVRLVISVNAPTCAGPLTSTFVN